ncbi:MAG: DNA-protecting protein DprA [Bacteroidales bacterium]|nr:DNA-protecting protein DprA [Bacteroidales bacterium]
MENNETVCACALGKVFGYEPRVALSLVENTGSAAAVFALSPKDRDGLLGPYSKYSGTLTDALLEQTAEELAGLERQGCRYLPLCDPAFPEALRECGDPPAGLYYRSCSAPEEIFRARPAIAIVGTRDMSPYGKEWCTRVVSALSQAPEKPVIVSGLAYGIDITAHLAALGHGLSTIAVLPNGIETVYPNAHAVAAGKIAASEGSALVTDYPPGTGPVAFTFLRRNRIIAALSRATILIESKKHGGGLITAELAVGYGREVFALPGRIDDLRSEGCNILIREKKAEPIVNLAEVGLQLGLGRYNLRARKGFLDKIRDYYKDLPESQKALMLKTAEFIHRQRGITVDELCTVLELPYAEVSPVVLTLESDGLICTDLLGRCTVNMNML